jgi:hypothetical protein
MRITADTARLRRVLDTLQIDGVVIPVNLDGQTADVTVPPIVLIHYEQGTQSATLSQARTPIVALPRGVDLPTLGEIGLRILGISGPEAHRLAAAIDWCPSRPTPRHSARWTWAARTGPRSRGR